MNTALRCATSAAAGNGLGTTIKYLRRSASGTAGNGLCTMIKYPRRTAGAAAGSGLDTTLNYLRGAKANSREQRLSSFDAKQAPPRATSLAPRQLNTALRCTAGAAAGSGLDTTLNYLRGAKANGRAQRSSSFDAKRAPPRATAWAPRSSTCSAQRAAPRATAGCNDQNLPCTTSGAAGNGLGTTIKYLRAAAGIGLGTTIKYQRGAAGIGLGSTIN